MTYIDKNVFFCGIFETFIIFVQKQVLEIQGFYKSATKRTFQLLSQKTQKTACKSFVYKKLYSLQKSSNKI
jgi:hypothetical protein